MDTLDEKFTESNTETKRKLASIQTISALEPISGADRIVAAKVLGWRVVVKKEDFSLGDKCVFFELDSLIPPGDWNQFLRKPPEGMDEKKREKLQSGPYRLRTVKLKGVVSQGLALPVSTFPQLTDKVDGEDVTDLLGIEKWETEIPAQLMGLIKGNFPNFLKKTDEERIQSNPACFSELKNAGDVNITMKMDGTSATFYFRSASANNPTDMFGVCSRNLDLKESEGNAYWSLIRKLDLENKMRDRAKFGDFAVQGELCGPGIQGNKMGLKEPTLYFFNFFSIDSQVYWSFDVLKRFCDDYGLTTVPTVYTGEFKWNSIDEMIKFADETKYPNGSPAEGLVWRPVKERYSDVLQGRLSIKTKSNVFLLKHGE